MPWFPAGPRVSGTCRVRLCAGQAWALQRFVSGQDQADRALFEIDTALKMLVVPVPEFGISEAHESLSQVPQPCGIGRNGEFGC